MLTYIWTITNHNHDSKARHPTWWLNHLRLHRSHPEAQYAIQHPHTSRKLTPNPADNEKRSKAKIEELQEQMKKTDERLDIVVDELQTCTLLVLRLKRTLAEFVEEHYEWRESVCLGQRQRRQTCWKAHRGSDTYRVASTILLIQNTPSKTSLTHDPPLHIPYRKNYKTFPPLTPRIEHTTSPSLPLQIIISLFGVTA